MSTVYAKETAAQHSSESLLYSCGFLAVLAESEVFTGYTPVASISPTGPTVGTPVVNTAAFVDGNGSTVAAGKGLQVRVSGLTAITDYVLTVTCETTASPNKHTMLCRIRCEA